MGSGSAFPSRRPVLIATIICGLFDLALIIFSIYTYVVTPNIDQVPIYVDQHLQRTETKFAYLSCAVWTQTFFFILVGYTALSWNAGLVRLPEERQAFYRASSPFVGNITLGQFNLFMAIVYTAGVGWFFIIGIARCLKLLN